MPESVQSCFELSIHFPVFFSRELWLSSSSRLVCYRDKCMDVLGIEAPQNHYSNFQNRKPCLHFFCSHDCVAVIPSRRDLTLVPFARW